MNMLDEARIASLTREYPETPAIEVLGDHICKLEKVIKDMIQDWAMCHDHPGSYTTIEACKLTEYSGKLRDLGVDVSHIW